MIDQYNRQEIKNMVKSAHTPEEYGYIALYIAIILDITPDKAIILVKGQRSFDE